MTLIILTIFAFIVIAFGKPLRWARQVIAAVVLCLVLAYFLHLLLTSFSSTPLLLPFAQ